MNDWLPKSNTLPRPRYLSLVGRIVEAIETGRIKPGERLPTHRALADRLGLSVQTVSRAYEELIRRGLAVGEVGRGTFVRASKAELTHPFIATGRGSEIIDLSILKPVNGEIHTARMRAALHALADDLPPYTMVSFRPNVALRSHREAAVSWLRRCGIETRPDNVQITNGATPGMTIALMTAARPGDVIVTEAIGHHTLAPLANYLGLRLRGLEIDDQGIIPEALDEACAGGHVRAAFVMPSATSPTVTIMGAERRQALVEIARRHDIYFVENDACGPLVENCPPPIAALAPERTFYISSFTKCLMPGLRSGYLVVPDVLIPAFTNRHLVTNWMATALIAEIARRWIEDGTAWEMVLWQREALRQRHELADEVLAGVPLRHHPHSLHLWMPLPDAWSEDQFVSHARLQGVAVAPGSSFAVEPDVETQAVRISLGPTSLDRLRQGLETVARLVRSEPEPALLAI